MKTNEFFESLGLTRTNLYIFIASLLVIALGYVLMAIGDTYDALSLYVSPIVLVIGYVVILPLSILYRSKKSKDEVKQ
ncbi:MAG: DUF3098 domain-containing protein [Candidatus Marinimicrobia bacterium]|jgi:ABC-type Na+ efflux pump permease subunit|nr:DUF3098 domain-containing protein [Candidatus Neomarinimicrobiota bacterium]MDD4961976.1 DUF3098 domain-containing protein [Candidatus Neomarinimicrobiota bacterium]MDD5709779.1 DUF3098 domain-containing protein [Candidatus Neomarinimicrobiota bacterium]MDX9777494.1 DUF3098 domain-containing protein [bacterium]